MANKKYKLTDGNMWATDGIHDFGQNKTQRTINSEVNSALGGKAPTNHASTATTYGAASTSNYGHVKLSNTTPSMDGTAAVGDSTDVARANHVHPSDTSRVPTTRKINGMDLSQDRTLTSENIGYNSSTTYSSGTVGKAVSDLNGAINDVEGQITDNIQTNLTAKKKYEIGECFVYDDNLYRATQVINNGSAINIGTNAAKITLDTAIYDNYAFASLAFVASADVSSSASFDRTGNMITPVGYFSTSTAKSSNAELGTVGITLRKRQLFACIDINTHLIYAVYFNTNGSITAVEGVPQGYFRFIGTIII